MVVILLVIVPAFVLRPRPSSSNERGLINSIEKYYFPSIREKLINAWHVVLFSKTVRSNLRVAAAAQVRSPSGLFLRVMKTKPKNDKKQ